MSAYRLGNAPNLYNADGSPAGQMGLDGKEYPVSGDRAESFRRNNIILFGDSKSANYEAINSTQKYTTSYGAFSKINEYLGNRFRVYRNAGVSGNTTTQMLARIDTDVTPYLANGSAGFVYMCGPGIIDIHAGVSFDTTMRPNLDSIFQKLNAAGATILLGTCWPSSTTTASEAFTSELNKLNDYYKRLPLTYSSVIVVDEAAAVTTVSGAVLTNALSDGTHGAPLGVDRIGRAWYECLDKLIPRLDRRTYSANDFMDAADNPALNGTSGTLGTGQLGTAPNRYTLQRTGTAIVATGSQIARSDWRAGSMFRAAVSVGGAAGNRLQLSGSQIKYIARPQNTVVNVNKRFVGANGAHYQVTTAGTTANTADPSAAWSTNYGATITDGTVTLRCIQKFSVGDTIMGEMEYAISSLATSQVVPMLKCYLQDDAGVTIQQFSANIYSGTEGSVPSTLAIAEGVIATPEIVIPATWDPSTATTTVGPQIQVIPELWFLGAATCNWDIGFASIKKV